MRRRHGAALVAAAMVLRVGAAFAGPYEGKPNPAYSDGTGDDQVERLNSQQLDEGGVAPPPPASAPYATYGSPASPQGSYPPSAYGAPPPPPPAAPGAAYPPAAYPAPPPGYAPPGYAPPGYAPSSSPPPGYAPPGYPSSYPGEPPGTPSGYAAPPPG